MNIEKYFSQIDVLNKNVIDDMFEKYGEDNVIDFLENVEQVAKNSNKKNDKLSKKISFYTKNKELIISELQVDEEDEEISFFDEENDEDFTMTDKSSRYNPIKVYLKKMGSYPLLTNEEEEKCAQDIKNARNLSIVKEITIESFSNKRSKSRYTNIIDLNKLFVSLNDENRDSVIEKLNSYYLLKEGNKSKAIRYYLEKYQELLEENNNPTINDLNNFFSKNNQYKYLHKFKSEDVIPSNKLKKEVNTYIKALLSSDKLYIGNLRLVVSIAKKFYNAKMDFLDIVEEGNIGLSKAIDRFDVDMGYKFSTYATWWVKQSIVRGIADKARVIRYPVHINESIRKYHHSVENLAKKLEHIPSKSEISKYLNMSPKKVDIMEGFLQDVLSLDSFIDDDSDSTLKDYIPDDGTTVEEKVDLRFLREKIYKILDDFSPREKEIIILRFGLEDGIQRTLEEIAGKYGLTRERIRQIELITLRKLRNPKYARVLKEFM